MFVKNEKESFLTGNKKFWIDREVFLILIDFDVPQIFDRIECLYGDPKY